MPQWDFLNFLADMGRQYPAFQVRMSAEVTDLMETVARWTNDRSGFGQVQARRAWPTGITQRVQLIVQNRVISRVLNRKSPLTPPYALRLLARFPFLRRVPARMIGLEGTALNMGRRRPAESAVRILEQSLKVGRGDGLMDR